MEELDFSNEADAMATSPESGERSVEAVEKQRENAKKAAEKVKKAQKDESKWRAYSNMLAKVLVELVKSEKDQGVVDTLVALSKANVPSSFSVSAASIASELAYGAVCTHFGKEKTHLDDVSSRGRVVFKEWILSGNERSRINEWVEFLFLSLTRDASVVFSQKFSKSLKDASEKTLFTDSLATMFTAFLSSRNVEISRADASAYGWFILRELEKALETGMKEEW